MGATRTTLLGQRSAALLIFPLANIVQASCSWHSGTRVAGGSPHSNIYSVSAEQHQEGRAGRRSTRTPRRSGRFCCCCCCCGPPAFAGCTVAVAGVCVKIKEFGSAAMQATLPCRESVSPSLRVRASIPPQRRQCVISCAEQYMMAE